jgi:flagellar biosynthesis/type III secretory pathway protein FliH
MKYRAFKRPDGMYTITDQNTGQTLKLATPNLELANRIAQELNEAYSQGYQLGYTEAKGENENK